MAKSNTRRTERNGITPREGKLIRGLVEGKKLTDAAVEAGYPGDRDAACASASRALNRARVQAAYDLALDKAGLSIDKQAEIIVDATKATKLVTSGFKTHEVKDHSIRLRANEQAGRFRGALSSDLEDVAGAAAAGAAMGVGFFVAKGRAARGLPPL